MALSSFPPAHKKSLMRAVCLYALIMAGAAGWIYMNAKKTVDDWEKRTPHAVATVKSVYVENGGETAGEKPADFAAGVELPPAAAGEGYVSLIMTGIGVSEADTQRAMEDLPTEVTLAFSPYGRNTPDWIRKAKEANREALLLIPMEPSSYPKDDPGPQALLTRQSDAENTRRLDWALRQGGEATGAMNFMGSALLANEKNLTGVMNTLYKRSALFVEDPQGEPSIAEEVAEQTRTPFLRADLKLDNTATDLAVKQQLVALENIAKQRGYAVGIVRPYPVSFAAIKSWAASLDKRGIKLVPLAALWKAKARHDQQAAPQIQNQEPPKP